MKWIFSLISNKYASWRAPCSFTLSLHLPFIQAADRAGYRVKVTGTFGCVKPTAGLDAPREPRWILLMWGRNCNRKAVGKRMQWNEREDENTKHVHEAANASGGRTERVLVRFHNENGERNDGAVTSRCSVATDSVHTVRGACVGGENTQALCANEGVCESLSFKALVCVCTSSNTGESALIFTCPVFSWFISMYCIVSSKLNIKFEHHALSVMLSNSLKLQLQKVTQSWILIIAMVRAFTSRFF